MNSNNTYNTKKSVMNKQMVIVICVIAFVVFMIVAATIFVIVSSRSDFDKASISAKQTTSQNEPVPAPVQTEPILGILECPEQVTSDNPNFTVEGIIVSDCAGCSLTINGDNVASTGSAGNQIKWSKSYQLKSGETKNLVFEVKDTNGNTVTETRSVYCQPLKTVPKQTTTKASKTTPSYNSNVITFTKRKPGGLNIRKYPGTEYSKIDYIGANDYKSQMIYAGQSVTGADGYVWYYIIAPNGRYGYVRSDLVK